MKNLPKKCKYCESESIKQSSTYPSDWFCNNCKNGGKILNEENKLNDYNDPFTIIKKDKDGKIIDIVHWEI